MMILRYSFIFLLGVWTNSPSPTLCDEIAPAATQMIQKIGKDIVQILQSKKSKNEQKEQFRAIYTEHFNGPAIARQALRRKWTDATPEEKKEYVALFQDDMLSTYFSILEKYYNNDDFTVIKSEVMKNDPDSASIHCQIRRTNGQMIDLKFIVSHNKIIDIYIEKTSSGHAKFIEYREMFRKHGNTMRGFITGLAAKVAKNK